MITRYFVSYDIADPDRLRKVHDVVKASGERVQYSVYEALLTAKERVLFEARIKAVMNEKEDRVMFIALGRADRAELPEISTLGLPWRPTSRGSIVL